jgi:type VI secretion system secreted protein VgrG
VTESIASSSPDQSPLFRQGSKAATQQNRPIRIDIAGGNPDDLLLYEMDVREELGRPYEITVKMQSQEPSPPVSAGNVLGKEATIRMETEDSSRPRYFRGFVCEFEQIGPRAANGFYEYRAKIVPKFSLLKLKSDCRAFRNKSVKEILLRIIKDEEGIPVEYSERIEDYNFDGDKPGCCIQYRESTFNFVSRLLERAGVYYYFRHDASSTIMVSCLRSDGHDFFRLKSEPPCTSCGNGTVSKENPCTCERKFESYDFNPNAGTGGSIQEWNSMQTLCPDAITLDDYDYKRPKDLLKRTVGSAQNGYTLYDYPAGFSVGIDQSEKYDVLSINKLRDHYAESRLAQHCGDKNIRTGSGVIRTMGAGYKFTFAEDKKSYLTTSMDLHFSVPKFSGSSVAGEQSEMIRCLFRAMELGDTGNHYNVPMITPKPLIHGVQTAVVVAHDKQDPKLPHTDSLGRVLIRFHWDWESRGKQDDGNKASISDVWVRVSQISAGKGWGSMFIPRIGNEVIVAFEDGDPDRPLIVGCVYNELNKPMLNPVNHPRKSYICDDGDIANGDGSGNAICFDPESPESITVFSRSIVLHSPYHQATNDLFATIAANSPLALYGYKGIKTYTRRIIGASSKS